MPPDGSSVHSNSGISGLDDSRHGFSAQLVIRVEHVNPVYPGSQRHLGFSLEDEIGGKQTPPCLQ